DHQRIGKGCRYDVDLPAASNHGRWTVSGNLVQNVEGDLDVVLPIAAKRTSEAVQQESLSLVNCSVTQFGETQRRGPFGHRGCHGLAQFHFARIGKFSTHGSLD